MLSTVARAASRPSVGLARRAGVIASRANVAGNVPTSFRCASNLSKVIRAELEEEQLVSLSEDVSSMVDKLKKKGVTIKDEPGVSLVRLFAPGVGDEKVTVEFDCDVEGDGEEGWEDDLDDQTDQEGAPQLPEGDGEINDEDLDGPGYRFTASITKGARKMVLTGTATSSITLQGVRINSANTEWHSSLYRGPAFHELDPDLQDALVAYVEERHIDNDLAAFICMYADQKEQTEYINWLKDVGKFVK